MTGDFGGGKRRRGGIGWPVIVAGIAVVIVAIAVGGYFWRQPQEIAKAREWAIKGAPCVTASAEAFAAAPDKAAKSFDYDDVGFSYAYGDVSCDEIHDDGGRGFGTHPACQFTTPVVLKVTTKTGETYFMIPAGPATVTVRGGAPSCVRAAPFRRAPYQ